MYYTWSGSLVRTGASNMSGLIGSKSPEATNYRLMKSTPLDQKEQYLRLYKKESSETYLVQVKSLGLVANVKIEGLGNLMSYLTFQKDFLGASDYIESFYEDSEDDDEDDDAEEADDDAGAEAQAESVA